MAAAVLQTHTPALFQAAVTRAAELLRAGEVVALPTETVYGLAAHALNPTAVARIFDLKGRPAYNPIIVHVSSSEMARTCVRDWPPLAEKLARAFWPGPLTLVLPRASAIPDIVTAGGDTVGIRWPSHPFMQAVIAACNFPLAAPSANPSTQLSPTSAEHVQKFFGDKLPLIVDSGPSHVGIESTVLDLTVSPPAILRPGIIHSESLAAVVGVHASACLPGRSFRAEDGPVGGARPLAEPSGTLKSPGQLLKHYSPKAKLIIATWSTAEDFHRQAAPLPSPVHVIAHTHIPLDHPHVSIIPHDPEAYARALFAELHRCDEAGAQTILIESVPNTPAWHAIADRLQRAAAA